MLDTGVDRDDISEEVIRDLAVVTTTKNMRVITVDNKIVLIGSSRANRAI